MKLAHFTHFLSVCLIKVHSLLSKTNTRKLRRPDPYFCMSVYIKYSNAQSYNLLHSVELIHYNSRFMSKLSHLFVKCEMYYIIIDILRNIYI